MEMVYNIEQIIAKTGIQKPVLMMDWAKIEGGGILRSKCCLPDKLFFWDCHFIGNPVLPGTYMLEMLAQSAAFLEMELAGSNQVPIITSITNVRFLRVVKPNQILDAEVKIKSIVDQFYTATGKITCENKPVCKAELVHVFNKNERRI